MKLIVDNRELSGVFKRLIGSYPNTTFAVAWASANTSIFQQLISAPHFIRKGIIGTHFYQTHPDVLDAFLDSESVRFILQPEGVFHPKVFLFWGAEGWEALVGSANLTFAALNVNAEAVVHVSSSDQPSNELKDQILSVVENYWIDAEPANEASAGAYRALWAVKQPVLRHLAGQYGARKSRTSPVHVPLMSMSWELFLAEISGAKFFETDQGLQLLRSVRSAFREHSHFSSMDLALRQTIAGLPNQSDSRWGWFGSMKAAGYFRQAINRNDLHISTALSLIPQHGRVEKQNYREYLTEFAKAFPKGGDGIATASRLLTLKRPDQFVCFDSKNRVELCKHFGIVTLAGMDYERYWEEIIERILGSPWWGAPRPSDERDAAIWDGRAAMLDCIFYRP